MWIFRACAGSHRLCELGDRPTHSDGRTTLNCFLSAHPEPVEGSKRSGTLRSLRQAQGERTLRMELRHFLIPFILSLSKDSVIFANRYEVFDRPINVLRQGCCECRCCRKHSPAMQACHTLHPCRATQGKPIYSLSSLVVILTPLVSLLTSF
jgi:hypothetical protein